MTNNLEDMKGCDSSFYYKGEHILTIIDLKPIEIEEIVNSSSINSGQKIDWHYFGGYAVVKAFGDIDKAMESLKLNLRSYDSRKYKFIDSDASVLHW